MANPRGHGFGAVAQDRHARMATAIRDCEALPARWMGASTCESMRQAVIRSIVAGISLIGEAVRVYL